MKKRNIAIIIGICVALWGIIVGIDLYRTSHNQPPFFVVRARTFRNGQDVQSFGPGYTVFHYYNSLEQTSAYVMGFPWEQYDNAYFEKRHIAEFYGMVEDIREQGVIVMPLEKERERAAADRFYIPLPSVDESMIGSYFYVRYQGSIQETYPAQVTVLEHRLLPGIPFTYQQAATAEVTHGEAGQTAVICDSPSKMLSEVRALSAPSLLEYLSPYDSAFFAEHALILVAMRENGDAITDTLTGLYLDQGAVTVRIAREVPEASAIHETMRVFFIEVDKQALTQAESVILDIYSPIKN